MGIRIKMKFSAELATAVMGDKSNTKKTLFAVVVFWILLSFGHTANAQSSPLSDYCLNYGTLQCFDSLSKAEAALKAIPLHVPTAQYLQQISSDVNVISGEITYKYGYKLLPATQIYSPSYAGSSSVSLPCSPAASPYKSGWCESESELKTLLQNQITATVPAGCTFSAFTQTVTYASPYSTFSSIAFATNGTYIYPGQLSYGKIRFESTRSCPNGGTAGTYPATLVYAYEIVKHINFDCPAGFQSVDDGGSTSPNFSLPNACRAFSSWAVSPPSIKSMVRQVASCPANANPCHPATGDKSRAETDFEFAGRAFTRYYHSRKEFRDQNGSAIGWSNSYSERMQIDANNNPYLFTSEGQYESFKKIGISGSTHFRALNSPDRFVDTFSSGTVRFRLKDGNGEVRQYDVNGLLLSITNPDSPSNDLQLLYDSSKRLQYISDNNSRVLSFEYDESLGLLKKINRPDGAVVLYEYDADRNLTAVDYGSGVKKLYHYHETGLADPVYLNHLTGITSETGLRYASFAYDSAGRVISSKLHDGSGGFVAGTTVNYTGANTATVNTDTNDTRSYTMDPGTYRRVTGFSDGAGTSSSIYDADSRVTSKTDKRGIVTKYDYTDNYLSTVTNAFGTTLERKVVTVRDTNQRLTRREYYGLSAGTQQLQRIESSAYNTDGRLAFSCEADALIPAAASYVCGSSTTIPASVRQSAYTYCTASDVAALNSTCPRLGLIKSVDGPRTDLAGLNDITTYSYYSADATATCGTIPATCPYRKGDLWKVTNALNQTIEYTAYDGAGRVLQMKDINGVITDMEYNARGWLTARKVRGLDNSGEFYDDAITRMEYDANGQITKVMAADGYLLGDYINFTYDAAHRLTDMTDPQGNSIHYTLDNAGNRVKQETKDANGTLTRSMGSVYDTLGRMQASKNAANANVAYLTYDADSNVDKVTDALGRISDQDVDPLNRLKTSIQDFGAGKVNATTQFEYDARDNLAKVIDPKSLSTLYTYSGLNELTRLNSPDTGITDYTYDSAGNRKTQKDAKNTTTTYSYDALNRLTQVAYPTATLNSNFTYDTVNSTLCATTESFTKGRLTKFTDPSGSTEYCYDRFGNTTRKQITNNNTTSAFVFTYTRAGRLLSTTYPSGMQVAYSRNSANQVTQVLVTKAGVTKIFANNITYYPFGPLSKIQFLPPNSSSANPSLRVGAAAAAGGGGNCPPGGCTPVNPVIQTRLYDQDYAIQSVGGLNYSVDNQGNIKSITDAAGGNAFDYDSLDRLKQVKNSATLANVESYTYDETGNRSSKTVGATTASYSYPGTSHRLTATTASGFARVYDANGNTTQSASDMFFTYDDRNRMVDFRKSASTIDTQYQYNAKGERVRKYGSGGSQEYSYDESGKLLRHKKPLFDQEIIWLDDMPIGVSQGGELYGILSDHLNTPRQAFSIATQQTKWRWDAVDNAFGEKAAVASGLSLDLRFAGQFFDSESGMAYNYYRDCYEAATGRYCESDPIGLAGGMSTYSYVGGNPVNAIDPSGLLQEGSMADLCYNQPAWVCKGLIKQRKQSLCAVQKFTGRTNQRFIKTNKDVSGVLAPPGFTLITGASMARAMGTDTLLEATFGRAIANYAYFAAGRVQAPINWVGIGRAASLNFLAVGASYEVGLYAGSAASVGLDDAIYGAPAGAYGECGCSK
jgi:RHS repeat-associated protein